MRLTCANLVGAGDGNRTRMASLEGWGSTIELRPRSEAGTSAGPAQPPPVAYRVGSAISAWRAETGASGADQG